MMNRNVEQNIGLRPLFSYIVILALLLEPLIYTGFCFKQFRYISDEEKTRIAIEYVLKENRETIIKYKDRAVVYPYNSADEFFAGKPSICGASNSLRGGMDWIDKAFGHLSSYVTLEFMGVYKGAPEKVLGVIAVTNCGEAWNPWD